MDIGAPLDGWAEDTSGRVGPQRRQGAEHGRRDGEQHERGQRADHERGRSSARAAAGPPPRPHGAERRGLRRPSGRAPAPSGRPSRSADATATASSRADRSDAVAAAHPVRRPASALGGAAARRRRTPDGATGGERAARSDTRLDRRATGVHAEHEQLDGIGHRRVDGSASPCREASCGAARRAAHAPPPTASVPTGPATRGHDHGNGRAQRRRSTPAAPRPRLSGAPATGQRRPGAAGPPAGGAPPSADDEHRRHGERAATRSPATALMTTPR